MEILIPVDLKNTFEILEKELTKIPEPLIGKGACGYIYKAIWLKEIVAVKVLIKQRNHSQTSVNQFIDECNILKKFETS